MSMQLRSLVSSPARPRPRPLLYPPAPAAAPALAPCFTLPPPPPPPPLTPGLRTDTSIVVETAQCFSTHHVAMLVGYGAHAVCPYLAFESCRQWRASPRTENLIKAGKVGGGGGPD